MFQTDSRGLRTARQLLLHPGSLTREYLDGRRVRYLPPIQVYVVAAALLFLVGAYWPLVTFNPRTHYFRSGLGRIVGFADRLRDAEVARLAERGVSLDLFGERFLAAAMGHLSTFLVLSVPLFALAVALVVVRPRRPLTHHLIFALHWSAFALLVMSVSQLPQPPEGLRLPIDLLMVFGSMVYLAVALRRVYGVAWPGAILRAFLLYVAYQIILIAWLKTVINYTRSSI